MTEQSGRLQPRPVPEALELVARAPHGLLALGIVALAQPSRLTVKSAVRVIRITEGLLL